MKKEYRNAFHAVSVPATPKFAFTPIDSGIPSKTNLAEDFLSSSCHFFSFEMATIFSPNLVSPFLVLVNVKWFSSLPDYFLSILVKNNILLTLDDEFVIVVGVVVVGGLLTPSPGLNTPSDALLLVVAVALRLSSLF